MGSNPVSEAINLGSLFSLPYILTDECRLVKEPQRPVKLSRSSLVSRSHASVKLQLNRKNTCLEAIGFAVSNP